MKTRLRDTSALAIGSAVSGVLAYVFFALVTRALGPVAAAPVSVLGLLVLRGRRADLPAAALDLPLGHRARGRAVGARRPARRVPVSLGVAAVAGGASWLARDLLFHSDEPWFPLLVAAVTLGSAAMGVVRGVLTARRRFPRSGPGWSPRTPCAASPRWR